MKEVRELQAGGCIRWGGRHNRNLLSVCGESRHGFLIVLVSLNTDGFDEGVETVKSGRDLIYEVIYIWGSNGDGFHVRLVYRHASDMMVTSIESGVVLMVRLAFAT